MKSFISALLTILITLGSTSAALAQEEAATDKTLPIPLTMKDLSGKSNVALSVPMLPRAEGNYQYFGIAPMISGQYATGNLSFGLAIPMAAYCASGDCAFMLGNPTIDVLYRMCTQGEWSLCFGGGVDIGVALTKPDDFGEGAATNVGLWGHENWTYHWPESLVISPILVAGITNGMFVGQAELGTSVLVSIYGTEPGHTEAGLSFAFGGGVKLFNMLIPLIEFRGLAPLTFDWGDPLLWLSFGARLQLGGFSPMFRLSIPLNEMSKIGAPVQLEVALAYQF